MKVQLVKLFRFCSLTLFVLAIAIRHLLPQPSGNIRLNQIGFYPAMPKIAVVLNTRSTPFYIISTVTSDTVLRGTLTPEQKWPFSDDSVRRADFSDLRISGTYVLAVPGVGTSAPFEIKPNVHRDLAIGAIKAYYFQRASIALLPAYAGHWARAEGHPDTSILIHSSAATPQRPVNSTISCPGGWYDAGDYNKYIISSGITTYTLLSVYEHFPDFSRGLATNIPESTNSIPDILDEALWNIRWMLTMQDPNDGGVYCKLTNENFDAFIMPAQATSPRYVVMKTTAAALDFAAVMAQAARIASGFSSALPGLSDSCLRASLRAWNWAREHPAIYFDQQKMNAYYSPEIHTGMYPDNNLSDEFMWAATELFVTTAQDSFLTVAHPLKLPAATIPSWANVRTLALYTLAHHRSAVAGKIDTNRVRSQLLAMANTLCVSKKESAYDIAYGYEKSDFRWGGTGVAANQGMALLTAFELTGDSTYLYAALSNLDYLLGRNGTTFSFVTGFGSHTPHHIHHRISEADSVEAPIPGLLVGGPNPDMQDKHLVNYPSSLPALAYTDDTRSYASNEICIDWNAPLVYLSAGLEAVLSGENRHGDSK